MGGFLGGHNLVILSFDPTTSWHPSWRTLNRGGWWCFDVMHKLGGHEVVYLIFLGKNQGWCKMSGVSFFLAFVLEFPLFVGCWAALHLVTIPGFCNEVVKAVVSGSAYLGTTHFPLPSIGRYMTSTKGDFPFWNAVKKIIPLLLGGFRCTKTSFGKKDLPRTQMTLDLNGKGPSIGRFQKPQNGGQSPDYQV